MLTKIKRDTEDLLKVAFENYYLINSNARKGIMESGNPQQAPCEFPPAGLVAGVHLFETIRDALLPNDVEWLGDRFRVAAKARWARLVATFEDGSPEQVGHTVCVYRLCIQFTGGHQADTAHAGCACQGDG
jgi:hypothetical protein